MRNIFKRVDKMAQKRHNSGYDARRLCRAGFLRFGACEMPKKKGGGGRKC
jgi:hypothetical protein